MLRTWKDAGPLQVKLYAESYKRSEYKLIFENFFITVQAYGSVVLFTHGQLFCMKLTLAGFISLQNFVFNFPHHTYISFWSKISGMS